MAVSMAGMLVGLPWYYIRYEYTRSKRLRVVTPGAFYRSGQMTVDGFDDAISKYQLRTIVNLQDEYPDPDIRRTFWDARCEKESDLCRRRGVRYLFMPPDLLPRRQVATRRPAAIDRFLQVLDDPASYPILIHCKAGLHRTGVMNAVYRMEFDGWSPREAINELKANGFGDAACTAANDYIIQYVLTYRPGLRMGPGSCYSEQCEPRPDPRRRAPEELP